MPFAEHRLALLKTLGDNTRYAIYLELARSSAPMATADVAESLDLHPNTVRPHLERMREVGLLESRPDTRGAVGRPQKLYKLAADAPSLGLEPPVFPMLARMLVNMAVEAGLDGDAALETARTEGHRMANRLPMRERTCIDSAVAMLDELGFDPARVDTDHGAVVGFSHCPFADLAERNPDLVCSLHRGLVEGFVDEVGGSHVETFNDLSHRSPCQTELVLDLPSRPTATT